MSVKNKINVKEFLADLHKPRGDALAIGMKSSLHEGQIDLIAPIYNPEITIVFGACARKFSKSNSAIYVAYRQAGTVPNSLIYLVGPEKDHISRVYWDGGIIARYLEDDSDKYISKVRDREKEIHFKNGSMIKLMGSENWKAGQGLSPNLLIYDEFKAFHPKFHTEMAPNMGARGAKLFIIGTQPQVGDRNKLEYESILEYCKSNPDKASYKEYTTWDSPLNQIPHRKKAIEDHIAQLRAAGDEATVQREYYSRIVAGGTRAIFPMLSRDKHMRAHESIMGQIRGFEHQFSWYVFTDPAGSSTYAGIIVAKHNATKRLFILDELYETDKSNMRAKIVIPKLRDKMRDLNPYIAPEEWVKVADEAASLHLNDIASLFEDMAFMPTEKLKKENVKDSAHMVIKDALALDYIVFSDRCVNMFKEMEEYATNENGQVVKNRHIKDHTIDCLVYFIYHTKYNISEVIVANRELPEGWDWFLKGFSLFGLEKSGELDEFFDYDDDFGDFETF